MHEPLGEIYFFRRRECAWVSEIRSGMSWKKNRIMGKPILIWGILLQSGI